MHSDVAGEEIGAFLDLLYAAACTPQHWGPAMEKLADLLGGSSAALSRFNAADGSGSGITARIDPIMPVRYASHFASRNPFSNHKDARAYVRSWTPKIRFHDDFLPREDVVRTEFYNDFLRPQRIESSMMIGLAASGFETCVLNINHATGTFNAAQVALAQCLHPHLRRAFALSCTLGVATDAPSHRDLLQTLDAVAHAILLVDADGRVRHANARAALMLGSTSGLRVENGVLAASDRSSARQLLAAIGLATAPDAHRRSAASLGIVRNGTSALHVSVTPLRGGDHGVFATEALAMVTIKDPDASRDAAGERLQSHYGLTPAETRVALALLDGLRPRDAASQLGVSVQTVRNQLQSLYEKTATSRQAELVLLLDRIIQ